MPKPEPGPKKKTKTSSQLRSAATALRQEALELGKTAHAHAVEQSKLDTRARELIDELDALLAEGGREDERVPSILGDAMLELMFVLEGGEGPKSLQLGSQLS